MSVLKKRNVRAAAAAAAVIFIFLLFSCAGGPEVVSTERPVHFLPDDSQILGKIDTAANSELFTELILSLMPGEEELGRALERTENVYFTMHAGDSEGESLVSFIIQGKFPKGLTESAIKKAEGWERRKGIIPWWENSITGMQFSVPEKNLIFFSRGKLEEMLSHYFSGRIKPLSYEVLKELEVSDLVLYMGDPGAGLLKGLPVDTDKFPLKALWFTLFRDERGYRLSGVFLLSDEKQSKAMAMLSRIFMVGWFRQNKLGTMEELKESMEINAIGNSVRIGGIILDADEVLRLIFSFIPKEETGLT